MDEFEKGWFVVLVEDGDDVVFGEFVGKVVKVDEGCVVIVGMLGGRGGDFVFKFFFIECLNGVYLVYFLGGVVGCGLRVVVVLEEKVEYLIGKILVGNKVRL